MKSNNLGTNKANIDQNKDKAGRQQQGGGLGGAGQRNPTGTTQTPAGGKTGTTTVNPHDPRNKDRT